MHILHREFFIKGWFGWFFLYFFIIEYEYFTRPSSETMLFLAGSALFMVVYPRIA